MFWRLHRAIFGNRIEEAKTILERLGDTYQIVDGKPSQLESMPFTTTNEPVLAITTLQDAQRLIRQDYPSTPWLFFNNTHYKVSYWLPRIDEYISVLNTHTMFVPKGLLKQLTFTQLNALANNNKLFIKPDSGNKIFTGFIVANDCNFIKNVEENLLFSHTELEEMCVVSPCQEIEEIEWRFWIAEREIIAYTPYAWETEPQFYEPPDEVLKLAQAMTQNSWQPDYIYVADFCMLKNGQVKLIEINAASTSGVYNANLNTLLKGMRKTCVREYEGLIDY